MNPTGISAKHPIDQTIDALVNEVLQSSYESASRAPRRRLSEGEQVLVGVGREAQRSLLSDLMVGARERTLNLFGVADDAIVGTKELPNVIYNMNAMRAAGTIPAGVSMADVAIADSLTAGAASSTATVSLEAAAGGAAVARTTGVAAGLGSRLTAYGAILYGAYDLVRNFGRSSPAQGAMSGLTAGAGLGLLLGNPLLGAGIGAVVGGLLGLFKAGKHADQIARDQVREVMQTRGMLDKEWTIGLADGSRFNIGYDGGPKSELGGRRPFEVDLKDPIAREVIGLAQPLAAFLCGGSGKLKDDFTGYFVNAALSNAGGDIDRARNNVRAIFEQFTMKPEELLTGLQQMAQAGSISKDEYIAYLGGVKALLKDERAASHVRESE